MTDQATDRAVFIFSPPGTIRGSGARARGSEFRAGTGIRRLVIASEIACGGLT